MSRFLDTTGETTLGVGVCARCARKFPLSKLMDDGNVPGLKVCEADWDEFDPHRLAPRAPDNIELPFYCPDVSVATNSA